MGFLIIPILLEALFWRELFVTTPPETNNRSILQGSAIANTTSFLVGAGISYLISAGLWFFPGLLFFGACIITLWLTVLVVGILILSVLRGLWSMLQQRQNQKWIQ